MSVMLWADFACSAAFISTSISVAPLASNSQPGIRSPHFNAFAMVHPAVPRFRRPACVDDTMAVFKASSMAQKAACSLPAQRRGHGLRHALFLEQSVKILHRCESVL